MKNIESSMTFNVDIENLGIPEIKVRECVMISEELDLIKDLCTSPDIEDDTRELLKRDAAALKKKWDFIWNYPEKKGAAANE